MLSQLHAKLVNNAAQLLKVPAHLVPKTVQNKILLEALQHLFHEALDDGDFEFLEQKWLKVSVNDLDLHWFISFDNEALIVSKTEQKADVTFAGNLNDLVLIAGRKQDPDTLFFQRRLVIEGDTELGLEVKNLMDSVDFDALPYALNFGLNQLAEFVQKGVYSGTEKNQDSPNQHAYSN
ncbi:MAG: ubiquinone anaerobic biosynthesis accessory factor UbiT [Vibrio sp.]